MQLKKLTLGIRPKPMADIIGLVLIFFSIAFIFPFFTGYYYKEEFNKLIISYILPAFFSLILGIVLWYYGERSSEAIRDREAFASVSIGWLIIAFLGSLPFVFHGFDLVNSYFESMSGFTTTGLSIINDLNTVPKSLILWRSLTQWLGGLGIVVLSVVILARILGSSSQLFSAETSRVSMIRLKPKIQQTARILLSVYALYTIIQIVLLYLAGMGWFDSVNHSFTTLATGGFSTRNEGIAYYEKTNYNYIAIQCIIITFMIIGGINFILHYHLLTKNWRKMFYDSEFRFYMLIILIPSIILIVRLSFTYGIDAIRYGLFNSVSMITTTGYANTDYGNWDSFSKLIILLLMFIGASSGSTSGAIKSIRFLVLLKMANREVKKVLHPKAIIPITIGNRVISEEMLRNVVVYFFIYLLIFIFGSLIMATITDIETGTSIVASSMGNVGGGLGEASPSNTITQFPQFIKIFLSILMWLGRLEIFAGLILFFPSTYRR